jgi:hypothetical protein
MTITFEEAKREQVRLRMALLAVSGAGKTRGALEVATNLLGGGLNVYGIDTEHGRMRLYADRYRFKHADLLRDQSPDAFMRAFDVAESQKAEVIIVDSVSHEWIGKGGVLSMADKFGDWKKVRPKHNDFVERILVSPAHVIVCIRAKMKYAVTEEEDTRPNRSGTRQVISKLGLGPVQDEQLLYEFDVVGDIDVVTHETTFSNRCDPLVGQTMSLVPGKPVADILSAWLESGDPPEEAAPETVERLRALLLENGISEERIASGFAAARTSRGGVLTPEYVAEQTAKQEAMKAEKAEKAQAPK